MSAVHSTMMSLGTPAPDFALPDVVSGRTIKRDDFANKPALLVAFICNHCPFVVHIREPLAALIKEFQPRGLAMVAVCSNDATRYPDDAPDLMAAMALRLHFTFPYLYDESQQVAHAYRAACTPDFYVFDGLRRLVYRGRFDDARPGRSGPVTGTELRAGIESAFGGPAVPELAQRPSVGCNIKWKSGSEPPWFGS